jgi:hypothetical protein
MISPLAPADFALDSASATNAAAPRTDAEAPRRSRVVVIIGADVGVLTVAIRAFSPRTPE